MKKNTADILNRQWKRWWKKVWRVECRGNVAWNNCGTVQIGLKEFAKARLEFVGINARNMFFGNEYKLALRVERDTLLANEIRDLLMKFPILLPFSCEIREKESTTIAIYNVHTAKPLAAMTSKQMTKFLNKLYTKKLNYCCYQLVERSRITSKKTQSYEAVKVTEGKPFPNLVANLKKGIAAELHECSYRS